MEKTNYEECEIEVIFDVFILTHILAKIIKN